MRIALGIEYDGSEFHGWQSQIELPTIQSSLEIALSNIANTPITIFCAGRTDAGVHATGQVIHFDTTVIRPMRAWVYGTNSHLPSSIAVKWAQEVPIDFHARFSALSRRYHYYIYNHPIRSPFQANRSTWIYEKLDITLMQEASHYLIGEQDFTSFRSSQCESKTPMRNVHEIKITQKNNRVLIDIKANAFLHHMVRNIVGCLLEVGTQRREPQWIEAVLHAKDRKLAAITAPASGLYLIQVEYPNLFV